MVAVGRTRRRVQARAWPGDGGVLSFEADELPIHTAQMMDEREQLRSLIEEILADGFVMQLATIDAQGPWVASLVYVHDRLDLYWVSTADSRHSKSVSADSRAAVNIVADSGTDKERALQIKGTAIRIEGPLVELEQRLQLKRGMPIPQTPGEILVDGYEWYKFVPAEFGIIYNTLFGYDRKNYTP